MADLLSNNLVVPALILAVLGWLVPVWLSRRMKEGVKPLMRLAFYAILILFVLASGLFYILYLSQGATSQSLVQLGMIENIVFFGRLGLSSAMIWAPVMLLSVMNRPRHWVKETW